MKKIINIFGSTGSIGCTALKLISNNPANFTVGVLTAGNNVDLLIKQSLIYKPKLVVINNEKYYEKLKQVLSPHNIKVATGREEIINAAKITADITIAAIVGIAGLEPVLESIKNSKILALANKESIVCGGHFVLELAKKYDTKILPVDSEHNAIFQAMQGQAEKENYPAKIILTASGGGFLHKSRSELKNITPEQAVKHPNWNMGAKISIDSATMMNKGLEFIEAHYLFNYAPENIEIIIHPESIIHGMIRFIDGSIIATMGEPDMTIPISYCLNYPKRLANNVKPFDFSKNFTFVKPDEIRFPALRLAREVLQQGGNAPIIFNAANEVAVARFLRKEIAFLDIENIVENTLNKNNNFSGNSLEDILIADKNARILAME